MIKQILIGIRIYKVLTKDKKIVSQQMFKVLILTEKVIKNPSSTLNRQIISQIKDRVQYSPHQSPVKCQSNLKTNLSEKKAEHEHDKNHPLRMTEIEGKFKLFHQYKLQKLQDNFNHEIIEKKRQQLALLTRLKTTVLAILNVSFINLQKVMQKLEQVKEQIQTVDKIHEGVLKKINQKQQNQVCDVVIYFKNSLICQEFYKLCHQEFMLLSVFLKEVIILERQNSQEISYNNILKILNYLSPRTKQQNLLALNQGQIQDNNKQQLQWIELPKCVDCLLKLQYEVSGIEEKVLFQISENRKQKIKASKQKTNFGCQACSILAQHRKQSQIHRKLSYEEGYKDYHKSEKHAHCDDCKQKNDIWICMVCASVGCGRYKNADAYKHFVKSGHIITIDLETERVWNYLSDCFSHKILKTLNEPNLNVKFPQINDQEGENIQSSKLEAAFWQYCSVFSDQMQRQRIFYENIKKSEQEKWLMQSDKLDKIITQLQKQHSQKSLQLRKSQKKKGKVLKKQKQLENKISQERYALKQQEECISRDFMKDLIENDEDVVSKRRELQSLQKELEELLIELSSS